MIFSERDELYAVARPSVVCLSALSSGVWPLTFVRPTQAVQIFHNISTAFGTLAIRWHPQKIFSLLKKCIRFATKPILHCPPYLRQFG